MSKFSVKAIDKAYSDATHKDSSMWIGAGVGNRKVVLGNNMERVCKYLLRYLPTYLRYLGMQVPKVGVDMRTRIYKNASIQVFCW